MSISRYFGVYLVWPIHYIVTQQQKQCCHHDNFSLFKICDRKQDICYIFFRFSFICYIYCKEICLDHSHRRRKQFREANKNLSEYDRFSWKISLYKLLKLGHWAAVPEVKDVSPKNGHHQKFWPKSTNWMPKLFQIWPNLFQVWAGGPLFLSPPHLQRLRFWLLRDFMLLTQDGERLEAKLI